MNIGYEWWYCMMKTWEYLRPNKVITQACNEVPELIIVDDAASKENIQRLFMAVKESKYEIG